MPSPSPDALPLQLLNEDDAGVDGSECPARHSDSDDSNVYYDDSEEDSGMFTHLLVAHSTTGIDLRPRGDIAASETQQSSAANTFCFPTL